MTPSVSAGHRRYLILGGTCGLAWAAAMRGWMAQLAAGMPDSHSTFTWLTLLLVLLPGVVVGVLLGSAAYRRAAGLPAYPPLVAAPVAFASAILDPHIFAELIRNGTGGGSLIVVTTALAIGYSLTHTDWSVRRSLAGLIGVLGLLVVFGMGGLAAPLDTAHGAFVSALGCALVLLLGIAATLGYPPPHALGRRRTALVGLVGLTWTGALVGFLVQITPDRGTTAGWVRDVWLGLYLASLLAVLAGATAMSLARRAPSAI